MTWTWTTRVATSPPDENGKRVKPVATVFADYLLLLPETEDLVIWSAKSTAHKEARRINMLLRKPLRIGNTRIARPPAWARTYEVVTKEVPGDNPYFAIRYKPSTVTPEEIRSMCAAFHEQHKNLAVKVADSEIQDAAAEGREREPGEEGDADIPY